MKLPLHEFSSVKATAPSPKPTCKIQMLVYNHLRSRGILACPTVVQLETSNQFKKQTDYKAIPYCRRG